MLVETIKATMKHPAPSFDRNDLLTGVDDALATINCFLDKSKQALSDYKSNWVSVIQTYETDIAQFDAMLEQFPISKRRKKAKRRNNGNASNHALNFHIQQGHDRNDIDDMFMLPPTEEDDEGNSFSKLDESMSHVKNASSKVDNRDKHKKKTSEKRRKEEEILKFNSRENMLGKLDAMRDNELEFERLLAEGREQGIGADGLPFDENRRAEIQEALHRCKQQQSVQIVHWVTSYRPRKNMKTGRKGVQELCPLIRDSINGLNEVKHTRKKNTQGNKMQTTRSQPTSNLFSRFPAYKKVGNDKNICKMIMDDDEQFMSIENLPYRPLSAALTGHHLEPPVDDVSIRDHDTEGNADKISSSNSIYDDDYGDDYDDDGYEDDDGGNYEEEESDYEESFEEDE